MVKAKGRKGSEGFVSEDYDTNKNQLALYSVRRDVIYKRVENILELAHKAETDPNHYRAFHTSALNLDKMREDYQAVLESYNLLHLQLHPDSEVDYESWSAFEDMFCYIKQVLIDNETKVSPEQASSSKPICRLPKLELVSFDGDVKNWPLFYQQFKSIIHENASLTDSEKVYYLVGKLTGNAANVCSGLPTTAENYSIIWNALLQKYDDPRSLASAYLNQLLSFKQLTATNAGGLDSFINKFNSAVEALKQLNLDDLTDFLFLHLALQKLDSDTIKLFEITYRKEKIPSYQHLIQFVKEQNKVLSRSPNATISKPVDSATRPRSLIQKPKAFVSTDVANGTSASDKCSLCSSKQHDHLFSCQSFMKMTPHERFKFIKSNSFCNNCLSVKHRTLSCTSKRNCSHCSLRHHSLLHFNTTDKSHCNVSAVMSTPAKNNNCSATANNAVIPATATAHASTRACPDATVDNSAQANMDCATAAVRVQNSLPPVCTIACADSDDCYQTTALLATAKIKVVDSLNRTHYLRALIYPGSMSDYITTACCKRLSLPIDKQPRISEASGLGEAAIRIKGKTALTFSSRIDDTCNYSIKPLVVDRITAPLPDSPLSKEVIDYSCKFALADDNFSEPGPIEVLLGVNVYCKILLSTKIMSSTPNIPTVIESTLGCLIMGDAAINNPPAVTRSQCALARDPLHELVENFWAVEEIPSRTFLSPEDQKCEDIYTSTTVRNADGSYCVDLPFKDDPQTLGDSFNTAKKRFMLLEKKFAKNTALKSGYDEVINDYLNKGILTRASPNESEVSGYFLPQHPVIRTDKISTKVRPVLDGSAKTDNGLSLNDILYSGCNLQANIFHILLNVRIYKKAFFADVKQMYLCIHVNPAHHKYQRILYRFNDTDPLEVLTFTRVTFGLRPSAFLAIRTLRQLADDERHRWPNAASVLERDVYMDDLASCASSPREAIKTADELITLFKAGGFELLKWSSNSLELLEHIPESHRQSEHISFDDESVFKILGLRWLPAHDNFVFNITSASTICTKRAILSATARLYDVLGLVGPVILYAKLIIKQLWLLTLDWDEVPPPHIVQLWQRYLAELPLISRLNFPRHLGIETASQVTLVGFSDASEAAYGCVVYSHVVNGDEPPVVTLLCSKSRVSSTRPKITLARLELCGILLLSRLLKEVYETMSKRHKINDIFAFSDSEVALCWSVASPHRFDTYVANRISQIQGNISPDRLYHVAGSQNPSDCVSRGLTPSQLLQHQLWFKGPTWLSLPVAHWPVKKFVPNRLQLPEEKTVSYVTTTVTRTDHPIMTLALRCSTWHKFLRVTVYVLRFIKKLPRNNAPPLQWPLGIITNVFPNSQDGVVRVAEVKTKTGTYRRPVVRLCPLPTQ